MSSLQVTESLPVVFVGHSLGALMAYEVKCRLKDSKMLRPSHMFVSAAVCPIQQSAKNLIAKSKCAYKCALSDDKFAEYVCNLTALSAPELYSTVDCRLRL